MLAEKLRQVFTWCTFDLLAASQPAWCPFSFATDSAIMYVLHVEGGVWGQGRCESACVACEASKTSSYAHTPDSWAATLKLPYISVCNVLVTFIIECRCRTTDSLSFPHFQTAVWLSGFESYGFWPASECAGAVAGIWMRGAHDIPHNSPTPNT